jgi:hypothetical protein
MKISELRELIRAEIHNVIQVQEKSVPQPYNRNSARDMTADQIKRRDTVGKKMLSKKEAVKYFQDNFGDEWEDYLWATATNIAIDGGE